MKNLHDRLGKLLVLGFDADIVPAQLSDYVVLLRLVGSEDSGLSSSVTDQTDSLQNTRRAGEFASFAAGARAAVARIGSDLARHSCVPERVTGQGGPTPSVAPDPHRSPLFRPLLPHLPCRCPHQR